MILKDLLRPDLDIKIVFTGIKLKLSLPEQKQFFPHRPNDRIKHLIQEPGSQKRTFQKKFQPVKEPKLL